MENGAFETLLRKQRCSLCNQILSVPPIMLTDLQKEAYKCGRCEQVKCKTFARNTLFENLVEKTIFPCTYSPCETKMPWNQVMSHERNCQFRTLSCPVYQNCSKVVSMDELGIHMKSKHYNNIIKSGKICEVMHNQNSFFVLEESGQYFFIYLIHVKGNIHVAVLATNPNNYIKFSMKLFSESDVALCYESMPISSYQERLQCFVCISRKCTLLHHPFSEKNQPGQMNLENFTTTFKREIINSVKTPTGNIRFSITLQQYSKSIKNEVKLDNENSGQINIDTLMKELECPCCMSSMVAPIYMCSRGHNICNVCKPKLAVCPLCKSSFSMSRNFALEHIADDLGLSNTQRCIIS